jgi:Repeat of unknown function (DUF5648)/Clostridium epsilon toxin ETX/Bacillus mosquitocidal toxin MTX2
MAIGDHFYTTSTYERDNATNRFGYHWEEIACYVLPAAVGSAVALWRLYNWSTGDHFYTVSTAERDAAVKAGYTLEGIAAWTPSQGGSAVPLFRLKNTEGDHFYTDSVNEREAMEKTGYNPEGVACYVYATEEAGTVALFRMWNRPHPIQQATEFRISSISYDTAHGTIQSTHLDSLYSIVIKNASSVPQSSQVEGTQAVTDTTGWSSTVEAKVGVTVSGEIGIPFVESGKIEVSAQAGYSYVWNGSKTVSKSWSWKQPVVVPAQSTIQASVAVAQSSVTVPYTVQGVFVFSDGSTAAAMQSGFYSGINSHDLSVSIANVTTALLNVADDGEADGKDEGLPPEQFSRWMGGILTIGQETDETEAQHA